MCVCGWCAGVATKPHSPHTSVGVVRNRSVPPRDHPERILDSRPQGGDTVRRAQRPLQRHRGDRQVGATLLLHGPLHRRPPLAVLRGVSGLCLYDLAHARRQDRRRRPHRDRRCLHVSAPFMPPSRPLHRQRAPVPSAVAPPTSPRPRCPRRGMPSAARRLPSPVRGAPPRRAPLRLCSRRLPRPQACHACLKHARRHPFRPCHAPCTPPPSMHVPHAA